MNLTSHKYKITVEIPKYDKFITNDISTLSIVRCPISNSASYAILNIQLKGLMFITMATEIENGDFPEISIKCELLDMREPEHASLSGKPIETLFVKHYKGLKVESYDYPTANSTYLNCTIVLVHPILLYLNNTNSYNKILLGKTGLELLESYEAHLTKTFGSSFEFVKVGESIQQNNHSYEQVLLRSENDLIMPSWIINEYKPTFTYSFYFFDDFRIDDSSTKDITAYFINLGAKDKFAKKSTITDADDIFLSNKYAKSYQLGDPFRTIDLDNPSTIVRSYDMAFKYGKAKGNTTVPSVTQSSNSIEFEKRKLSTVTVRPPKDKQVDPTEEAILYVPDTFENAQTRIEQNSKLLKTDLSGVAAYILQDSHFDFIQFGKNYILNPFESKEFRYTPIGIVNHFIRESGQYPYLIHHCNYQTIKFKADKDWM